MTGTVAQTISLVSHGNAFLISGKIEPEYFPKNSTFKYCNHVSFKRSKKPSLFRSAREVLVASDPVSWFHHLRKNGCSRLNLFYQSSHKKGELKDYRTAGFVGGGGVWAIEALHDGHTNYWTDRWEVTQKDDPKSRIWSVNYGNTFTGPRIKANRCTLTEARDMLQATLNEIMNFSENSGFGSWTTTFRNALDIMNSACPEKDRYYADSLVEKGYSLEARRVLFGATAAWVFGGMGSWNDLYIADKKMNEKYDQVSANLYNAITQAFLAAVNSTAEY